MVELSPGQLLYWKVKVWDEMTKIPNGVIPQKFSIDWLTRIAAASHIGYTDNEDEANK